MVGDKAEFGSEGSGRRVLTDLDRIFVGLDSGKSHWVVDSFMMTGFFGTGNRLKYISEHQLTKLLRDFSGDSNFSLCISNLQFSFFYFLN